jgi:hypothetical protein
VLIQHTQEKLNYQFQAIDTSDNSNMTDIASKKIKDNIKPKFINDLTSVTPTTGDEFQFIVEVTDNIAVSEVLVRYWFGNEAPDNTILANFKKDIWDCTITVKDSLEALNYIFFAKDSSGNLANSTVKELTVTDNDGPMAAAGDNITCTVGSEVVFDGGDSWDNIGIVNYSWVFTDNGKHLELYSEQIGYIFENIGNYTILLQVKDRVGLKGYDSIWVNVEPNATDHELPSDIHNNGTIDNKTDIALDPGSNQSNIDDKNKDKLPPETNSTIDKKDTSPHQEKEDSGVLECILLIINIILLIILFVNIFLLVRKDGKTNDKFEK